MIVSQQPLGEREKAQAVADVRSATGMHRRRGPGDRAIELSDNWLSKGRGFVCLCSGANIEEK